MKAFLCLGYTSLTLAAATYFAAAADSAGKQFWPQWRGPLATGVAPDANPPLEWSESKNVKWKVKIPGEGHSTPAVWGDRIFVLSAVPTGKKPETKSGNAETKPAVEAEERIRGSGGGGEGPQGEGRPREGRPPGGPGGPGGRGFGGGAPPTETFQFTAMCLDRKTGKTLWQKVAREAVPHEGHQRDNTFASGSPITDGKLLIAYFGSQGLHCYDVDGNLKWSKDFGKMRTKNGFGEGASPTLHEDRVIVVWDHEGEDFITALDKNTGKEIWRTSRSDDTGWSTPLVIEHGGKKQVVVNATGKVRSYNFADGKELWSCSGQTANAIPSPVANADTVFVTSGFRGNALFAIQLGRTGDLTDTDAIRWKHNKSTPYVPSPLLVDDLLYVVSGNNGIVSCFDAKTGTAHFEAERLEGVGGIYASPVSAKDRVYVLGRDGSCVVLKKGPKLEVLATNKLEDKTDSSIALVDKELFIRGKENLYCIAQ
jgi:outer membrane protein assembly factor BamB